MRASVSGQVSVRSTEPCRLDAGRFLSALARQLEERDATVTRHGATLTFADATIGPSLRPRGFCDGEVTVETDPRIGGRVSYELRFGRFLSLFAAVAGIFAAWAFWRAGGLTPWRCIALAVALAAALYALLAGLVVLWFRWLVGKTARAVLRPSSGAAA